VKQDFDSGAVGQYFFYPALRIDGRGDLDLTYGYSSSTIFPSLAATGQATTDPVDSLAAPQTLMAGSAADTSTRYGDYFGAGLDPSHPNVVWVAGEYHSTTTGACGSFGSCWSTRISSITMTTSVSLSINSLVRFTGINLNTTASLTISILNSTITGTAMVVARNETTGTLLFTKTYSIPSTRLQNRTSSLQTSFLLNIGVLPYTLSSDITVQLQGSTASANVQVTRTLDINGDHSVDAGDLSIFLAAFGTSSGSLGYNPKADFNADGFVNAFDLSVLLAYFGSTVFS
jgi:Dockerin type I domain